MSELENQYIDIQGDRDFERLPPIIVFSIVGLFLASVICYVCYILLRTRIPIQAPLYVITILGALTIREFSIFKRYFDDLIIHEPDQLLTLCFSLFALRAAYSINKKRFFKMLPLMLVAATGSILSGFAHGFIIKVVRDHHGDAKGELIHFLHGIMFCTTQPYFISSLFENMENFVFFHYLLEGESLLINTISLSFLDIISVYDSGALSEWPQIILFFAINLLGGIPVGALFGKLTTLVIIHLEFDAIKVNTFIISMGILIFNLSEILVISPYITITIFIFCIMFDSKKFSKDNDEAIATVLDITQLVLDIIIGVHCVLQIVYKSLDSSLDIFHFMLFNYVSILISRFVAFTAMYSLAKKVGYPYNFQTFTIILSWSSIMSTNILCKALIIQREDKENSSILLPYILFNFIMSHIINSPGIGICIKVICYQPISQPKVASMNTVIKHFMEIRDNSVYVLKMNRFMADVNWKHVRTITEIEHPYKNEKDHDDNSKGMIINPSCPFCDKEISFNLNNQNSIDIKRETRKHIWNYMKTIIVRQNEVGMISKDALMYIQNMFEENLIDENFGTINIHKLENCFRNSKTLDILKLIYKKIFSFQRCNILAPRKPCRKVCYKIVMHRAFNIIMYIVIVLTSLPVLLDFSSAIIPLEEYYYYTLIMTHIAFVIFFVECILNIFAYSWILFWRDGCRAYLRSFWHIIDIITLFFLLIEILMIWLYYIQRRHIYYSCYLAARPLRCLRLFRFFSGQFPRIMAVAENQYEARLLSSYEIVKAIRETIGEFLIVMDRVIAPSESRKEYHQKLVEDCESLYKLMLQIHIDCPWISTTVKTKQIISSCKYVMMETLTNLKSLGYVDEVEYNALALAIKYKEASQKMIKKIKAPPVVSLFFEIAWMHIEDLYNIGDFLYTRSSVRAFEKGYYIGQIGDYLDGLLIIIQGMLKIVYTPNEDTSTNFRKYGVLPVIDSLDDTDMDHAFEIYIFPGNTVGELNILTGRPYDCAVVCVTEVRAYFINIKYIAEAFKLTTHSVTGMECMMWKHSVMNLATTILLNSNVYEFNTFQEIHLKLERAVCPDLTGYNTFAVNNIIEDVLLLDGTVFDVFNKVLYRAPCHIPRSVVKIDIVFKKVYAKLVIIPIADVDNIILFQTDANVVELTSSDDGNAFGPKIKKRKKKGNKSKYDSTSGSRSSSMTTGNKNSRSSRKSISSSLASND